MADTAARLAISARRNEVARFTIAVTGIDMTGVAMAMQIRLDRDVPGAPLISLTTVATLAAEGLKLDSVTVKNGVPTSVIKGRINASTMTDAAKVPYMGEAGTDSVLAYAIQWTLGGDAQTRLYGDFIVVGSAFGSDGAPTNRPPSYGGSPLCPGGASSGSLTFGDQIFSVTLASSDLVGIEVDRAIIAAAQAVAAANNVNVVATGTDLRSATSKVIAVGTDLLLGAASKIAIVATDLAMGAGSLIGRALQAALDAQAARVAAETAAADSRQAAAGVPATTEKLASDHEQAIDDRGSIWRRTDAAGQQFIPGMNGRSVQQAAALARDAIKQGSGFRSTDLLQAEDADGRVTFRQDRSGGLFLPGMSGLSVQGALGQAVQRYVKFPTDARDKHHVSVAPLIAALVADGRPFIQPPRSLVPNNFTVPNGIVSAFSTPAPNPARGLYLETPHHPGGLVHPYLLEMRQPLLGYRYLFGDTPHLSGAKEENPCLWGSNDLRTFDLLPGVTQPLGHPPMGELGTWNADINFTYDPRNGELICCWIGTDNNGVAFLHYRSTWNGIDWTPERWVRDHSPGDTLSPATLFDPRTNLWHMWGIESEGSFHHWIGPTYAGPWTKVATVDTVALFGIRAWHTEVKWMGEKFVMLLNQRNENSNMFLGISADGDNWQFGPAIVQSPAGPVYKSTFEPEWNGSNLRLNVGWNAYSFPRVEGVTQYLYIEPTNTVDVTTL